MIPYKGYVEANLTIPDLPGYNEEHTDKESSNNLHIILL